MIALLFSLLVATQAMADDSIPAGCTTSQNFSAEAYKVWVSEGSKQTATEESAQSKTILVGKRTELQLIQKGSESRGFVNFAISDKGTYVIATDAYPHMDLRAPTTGESLTPTDFGKVRDCGTISKVLRFQLTNTGKYALGFVSSKSSVVNILIWRLK